MTNTEIQEAMDGLAKVAAYLCDYEHCEPAGKWIEPEERWIKRQCGCKRGFTETGAVYGCYEIRVAWRMLNEMREQAKGMQELAMTASDYIMEKDRANNGNYGHAARALERAVRKWEDDQQPRSDSELLDEALLYLKQAASVDGRDWFETQLYLGQVIECLEFDRRTQREDTP